MILGAKADAIKGASSRPKACKAEEDPRSCVERSEGSDREWLSSTCSSSSVIFLEKRRYKSKGVVDSKRMLNPSRRSEL